MGKLLICLILVAGSASAAILSTQASCDGVVVNGTNSAQCGSPTSASPFAAATASPNFASAGASSPFGSGHGANASAMVTEDLALTVTSGSTGGFFIACISANRDVASAAATAIFTGPSFTAQQVATGFGGSRIVDLETCENPFGPPVTVTPARFTLGVPIRAELLLTAQAGGVPISAGALASFKGFEFFDGSMNPLSAVTYSLVEVPEPAEVFSLMSGLVALLMVKRSTRPASKRRWPDGAPRCGARALTGHLPAI